MFTTLKKIFVIIFFCIGLTLILVKWVGPYLRSQSKTSLYATLTLSYAQRLEPVQYVVVHSFPESVSGMMDRLNKTGHSTHYLIDIYGHIIPLIPEDKVAWHVGESFWRGRKGLNAASIGIHLQNETLGQTPFTTPQIEAFKSLVSELKTKYAIPPENIMAHSDISPADKTDVGKAFPWSMVASAGIGYWPTGEEPTKSSYNPKKLLEIIGYNTADLDKALIAFERHFMPEVIPYEADFNHAGENLVLKKAVFNRDVLKRLNQVGHAYLNQAH